MPKTLFASTIEASDPGGSDLFIPSTGPEGAPPLYPTNIVNIVKVITGTSAVVAVPGTYPGPNEYPGSDVYPGRGSDLVARTLQPKTLTTGGV